VERNSTRDHQRFRSPLTVSGGIASFEDRVVDQKSLLLLADLAMYEAKKIGKNTVYLLDSLAAIGQTRPSSGKKG
jgi:GGDEF domain-containing protein